MAKINFDRKVTDSLTLGELMRIWEVFDSMGVGLKHYDNSPVTAKEFQTICERIKALNLVNNIEQ